MSGAILTKWDARKENDYSLLSYNNMVGIIIYSSIIRTGVYTVTLPKRDADSDSVTALPVILGEGGS